jgi:hypothetical protein
MIAKRFRVPTALLLTGSAMLFLAVAVKPYIPRTLAVSLALIGAVLVIRSLPRWFLIAHDEHEAELHRRDLADRGIPVRKLPHS